LSYFFIDGLSYVFNDQANDDYIKSCLVSVKQGCNGIKEMLMILWIFYQVIYKSSYIVVSRHRVKYLTKHRASQKISSGVDNNEWKFKRLLELMGYSIETLWSYWYCVSY
jgi:hypothetical protein